MARFVLCTVANALLEPRDWASGPITVCGEEHFFPGLVALAAHQRFHASAKVASYSICAGDHQETVASCRGFQVSCDRTRRVGLFEVRKVICHFCLGWQ